MGLGRGGNCRIYPIAFNATHAQLILWNKMGGRWKTRQRRGDDLWFTLRRRSHHDVAGEDVQGEEGGRSQLHSALKAAEFVQKEQKDARTGELGIPAKAKGKLQMNNNAESRHENPKTDAQRAAPKGQHDLWVCICSLAETQTTVWRRPEGGGGVGGWGAVCNRVNHNNKEKRPRTVSLKRLMK